MLKRLKKLKFWDKKQKEESPEELSSLRHDITPQDAKQPTQEALKKWRDNLKKTYYPGLTLEQIEQGLSKRERYKGEESKADTPTYYITDKKERKQYRRKFNPQGGMVDSEKQPVSTQDARREYSAPGSDLVKKHIFVWHSKTGKLYTLDEGKLSAHLGKRVHHTTPVAGDNVGMAGEIETDKEGNILFISDRSGHYAPRAEYLYHFITEKLFKSKDEKGLGATPNNAIKVVLTGTGKTWPVRLPTEDITLTYGQFSQTQGNEMQIRLKKALNKEIEGQAGALTEGENLKPSQIIALKRLNMVNRNNTGQPYLYSNQAQPQGSASMEGHYKQMPAISHEQALTLDYKQTPAPDHEQTLAPGYKQTPAAVPEQALAHSYNKTPAAVSEQALVHSYNKTPAASYIPVPEHRATSHRSSDPLTHEKVIKRYLLNTSLEQVQDDIKKSYGKDAEGEGRIDWFLSENFNKDLKGAWQDPAFTIIQQIIADRGLSTEFGSNLQQHAQNE